MGLGKKTLYMGFCGFPFSAKPIPSFLASPGYEKPVLSLGNDVQGADFACKCYNLGACFFSVWGAVPCHLLYFDFLQFAEF